MNPLIRCVGGDPLTTHPFDAAALEYDAMFTHTRLGRWLRQAVWERVEMVFQPGDHVLELGCGTGEDAVWLARQGVYVTATDASPAMLKTASRKAEAAGMMDQISFVQLDLADIAVQKPGFSEKPGFFDGSFSNFSALNCVPDRRPIAKALASWVRPGGHVVLVVMGPFCPWEVAWHLSHGEVRTAFRRFRSGIEAHVGNGVTARVWYPSPRRLRTEFAPYFRHLETVGIGALLPPSYLSHLVDRWPRLFDAVAALDCWLAPVFPWTWLNDHYLIAFERRRAEEWRS